MNTHTVCLDPGHGPGTVNGSPDGTYKEREFTWDLYTRLRPLLEGRGIRVVCTRAEDTKPSLTARCQVSNRAGADLFLSLHSNAFGSGGWDAAHGLLVYTSSGPETAARNVAAKAILARMAAAGVALHGTGLAHQMEYTVLAKTTAPAVLIEYGFHTNKNDVELLKDGGYRDKLALATAKGVCDFLGVPWAEQPEGGGEDTPQEKWGAESVRKAAEKGLLLGDEHGNAVVDEPMTLRQWCVLADRLGLL